MFRLMLFLFGLLLSSLWRPDDPPADDPPTDDGPPSQDDPPVAKFSQEDVDRIVAERLEREKRKSERDKERAREEAEAKALEEQHKFEELARKRGDQLVEVEEEKTQLEASRSELESRVKSAESERDRYKAIIETQWEARKEGVPEYVLEAIQERDVLDRIAYLDKHQEQLGSGPIGSPPSPRAPSSANGRERKEADKEAAEAQRQRTLSSL